MIDSKPLKTVSFLSTLSEEAKKLIVNINQIDDWLDKAQLICIKTDEETKYDFNCFTFPLRFASKIYRRNLALQEAQYDLQELKILINKLNDDYNPSNQIKINEKGGTLKSPKKLFGMTEKIINAFKKGIIS